MAKKQKDICREFWTNRQGEKKSFASFYQQARYKTEEEMAKIIIPAKPNPHKYKEYKYDWKYPKEYAWYKQQENPWVSASRFLTRIRQWVPMEDAILTWKEWEESRERRKKHRVIRIKEYIPVKTWYKEEDENDYKIEITLSKEEADVFRNEYYNLINTTIEKLSTLETDIEREETNEKLNKLKEELAVFNKYNH